MTNIEHPAATPIDTPAKVIEPTPGPDVAAIIKEHQGDVTSPTGILPDVTPIAWGASAQREDIEPDVSTLPNDHLYKQEVVRSYVDLDNEGNAKVSVTFFGGKDVLVTVNGGETSIHIDTVVDGEEVTVVFDARVTGDDPNIPDVRVVQTDDQSPNTDVDQQVKKLAEREYVQTNQVKVGDTLITWYSQPPENPQSDEASPPDQPTPPNQPAPREDSPKPTPQRSPFQPDDRPT